MTFSSELVVQIKESLKCHLLPLTQSWHFTVISPRTVRITTPASFHPRGPKPEAPESDQNLNVPWVQFLAEPYSYKHLSQPPLHPPPSPAHIKFPLNNAQPLQNFRNYYLYTDTISWGHIPTYSSVCFISGKLKWLIVWRSHAPIGPVFSEFYSSELGLEPPELHLCFLCLCDMSDLLFMVVVPDNENGNWTMETEMKRICNVIFAHMHTHTCMQAGRYARTHTHTHTHSRTHTLCENGKAKMEMRTEIIANRMQLGIAYICGKKHMKQNHQEWKWSAHDILNKGNIKGNRSWLYGLVMGTVTHIGVCMQLHSNCCWQWSQGVRGRSAS